MKYLDRDTLFHRLDPRTKIGMSLACACLIVILEKPIFLGLLCSTLFIFFLLLRPSPAAVKITLCVMASAFTATVISQGVFYGFEPRTRWLTFISENSGPLGHLTGGLHLYKEGLLYGAVQSLRLFSALLLSTIIVMTTYPSELILGLKSLGVPDKIGFIAMVSIRFVPSLAEEARRILTAQKLRGLKLKGIRGALNGFRYLLPPMIIDNLRNARRIALAAEVRAYSGKRVEVRTLRFAGIDVWVILITFVIVTLSIYDRFIA